MQWKLNNSSIGELQNYGTQQKQIYVNILAVHASIKSEMVLAEHTQELHTLSVNSFNM